VGAVPHSVILGGARYPAEQLRDVTTILAIPYFIEEVQGKGSATTGGLLTAISIPVAVIAPIGGRMSDEVGRRLPIFVGSLLVLLGVTVLLIAVSPDVPSWLLAATLLVMGIGLGLSVGPSSAAAIESTPIELAGTAAGTNSMMRYVGSIIGAGVLGAVLNTDGAAPSVDVFRLIFAVLVVVSVCATLCSLLVHRFPRTSAEVRPAARPVTRRAGRRLSPPTYNPFVTPASDTKPRLV
jgi:MFS family permease